MVSQLITSFTQVCVRIYCCSTAGITYVNDIYIFVKLTEYGRTLIVVHIAILNLNSNCNLCKIDSLIQFYKLHWFYRLRILY